MNEKITWSGYFCGLVVVRSSDRTRASRWESQTTYSVRTPASYYFWERRTFGINESGTSHIHWPTSVGDGLSFKITDSENSYLISLCFHWHIYKMGGILRISWTAWGLNESISWKTLKWVPGNVLNKGQRGWCQKCHRIKPDIELVRVWVVRGCFFL